MRSLVATTIIILVGTLSVQAETTKVAKQHEAVAGEYIVKLKSSNLLMTKGMLESQLNVGIKSVVNKKEQLLAVRAPLVEKQDAVIERLQSNPMVQYAEPNFIYKAEKTSTVKGYAKLWGMKNDTKPGFDVNAEKAWDISTGSKDVVVAVIDTGVDYTLKDLKENIWVNKGEIPNNGIDDDKNGFVDDVYGYNFADDKSDPKDDHGHGSHVSGTIGAKGDDSNNEIAGVTWNVRIMAVKFLSASGSGSLEGAVKAIDYATQNGAQIMSNSWGGGGFSKALEDSIKRANDKGILFVAAAGNDGANNDADPHYPSNYSVPNVLSVAAMDVQGQFADFTNYGKKSVHIAAPGVAIYSSTPEGYKAWSGTSMATPHVSGAAALLLSHEPGLTGVQLKERLLKTAKKIASAKNKTTTGGLLDVYAALQNEAPAPDPNDPENWAKVSFKLESPHPYKDGGKQVFTVKADGAKRFAIRFARFETEAKYDFVKITNSKGELVDILTGDQTGTLSSVIDGDTATLELSADTSVNGWGFAIEELSVSQ